MALNTFGDEKVIEDFEGHLPELRKCRGLVIDIRRNGGGSSGTGYAITKHLTRKSFLGSRWKTREHRAAFKAWGKFYAEKPPQEIAEIREKADGGDLERLERVIGTYNGTFWYESEASTMKPGRKGKLRMPVVVLIGHDTGSAAEDFLIAMDSIQRGTFVGQKTFGSTGQPLTFELPGGGSARVCTKRDTYPDGREFVGYGVMPHVSVEPSVEDLLSDRDVVLERGIEVLRGEMD